MTPDRIRQIFKALETGDGAAFFAHVADDVDWTVMGTHPLAGHYHSKADYAGAFAKLGKVLPQGAQLHVEHVMVKDDEAVVELRSLATAINGCGSTTATAWCSRSMATPSSAVAPTSTRRWWRVYSRKIQSREGSASVR
jgi:hypothetical protein